MLSNFVKFKNSKAIILLLVFLFLTSIAALSYLLINPPDSDTFSTDTFGLPQAKEAKIVELSNGDEFNLEAGYVVKEIGNKKIRMIAYNGSIPGPFIKVKQGGQTTIHFKNNLDIPTTIHSHGLRLDFQFDGTPYVSQDPVKPGETFTYVLKFPDGGTYWYHPHVREDYAQELGSYGNYQVAPIKYKLSQVNREVNLIVDDILIEDGALPPFYKDRVNFAIMGRFGNIMLVNGRVDFSESFNAGDIVRLNITNTANARPFELAIPGAKIKLVGSDLSPYEHEEYVDKIVIAPSERYVVDVYFEKPGEYQLINTSHDLALGPKEYKMAVFKVGSNPSKDSYIEQFNALNDYVDIKESADLFEKEYLYKSPDKRITLNLDPGKVKLSGGSMANLPCHRMPDGNWMGQCTEEKKKAWLEGITAIGSGMAWEKIHWEDHIYKINRETTNKDIKWEIVDDRTKKTNHNINDWKFKVGDIVKLRVYNDPMTAHPMQHPFHIHGQRMMALSVNGQDIKNKVWKDSILIQVGDTVDIIVEMSNPGVWMAHCHIAEHLQSGMMFNIAVGEEYFDDLHASSMMDM